jgi:hypothetical protein
MIRQTFLETLHIFVFESLLDTLYTDPTPKDLVRTPHSIITLLFRVKLLHTIHSMPRII